MIPDLNNKLYATLTGPAKIIGWCSIDSYKVKLIDGNIKTVHLNKIKKLISRVQAVGITFENEQELGEVHPMPSKIDEVNIWFEWSKFNLFREISKKRDKNIIGEM